MKTIIATLLFSFLLFKINAQCWRTFSTGSSANHSTGIKTDGTLWTWGENDNGQLGDNSTTSRLSPTAIAPVVTDWKVVVANGNHTLGIRLNGELWGWGYNGWGALGDGSTNNQQQPVRIGIETDWDTLVAGQGSSFAIKTNGTLWAWGYNGYNAVGIPGSLYYSTPTQVNSDNNWNTVSAGNYSGIALKTDGSMWQWGNGEYQGAPSAVPVQVGTDTDWMMAVHGSEHQLAIKNDGTLWSWGNNLYGQLGNGTNGWSPITPPQQVGTDNDWLMVSAGGQSSFAIKTDGSLWAWGGNNYGQYGNGTNISSNTPVQVGTATDWINVRAGASHVLALKSDGSLWAAGMNDRGQLGIGTTTDTNIFTQVSCGSVLPVSWLSFSAQLTAGLVFLEWKTVSEHNTSHFEIERQAITGNFTRIASIPAAGNSNTIRTYSFTDEHPSQGQNIYRIKQVDTDGRSSYSLARVVMINFPGDELVLFPVPATTSLFVKLPPGIERGRALITIQDSEGKLIKLERINMPSNMISVNVQELRPGTYYFILNDGTKRYSAKFTRQ